MHIMPLGTQRHIVDKLRDIDHPVTNAELADLCGYGIRTIQYNMKDLLLSGAVERTRMGEKGRRSWRYQYKVVADV